MDGHEDGEDDGFEDVSDEDDDDQDEAGPSTSTSSSLKLHAKSLKEVVSKSDVVVQVLDARDPEGTRSRKIEREVVQVHGKKLVLVLNKIGRFSLSFAFVLAGTHFSLLQTSYRKRT